MRNYLQSKDNVWRKDSKTLLENDIIVKLIEACAYERFLWIRAKIRPVIDKIA